MPRSLITGVTGQDGWYLSELLRQRGEEVFGLVTPGDSATPPLEVEAVPGDMRDAQSLQAALEVARPDVVYNLASMSSVGMSWQQPELCADVNGMGVLRLLAAIRERAERGDRGAATIRLVQASSAEIFGAAPAPQDEQTPVRPNTPYGAAKAFAQHAVAVYRAAGMHASTAIFYNHESPRRPPEFVTRKITSTVARIALGSDELLTLGNLDARRDWGHARDYMRAAVLIAEHGQPSDFVIASGISRTIADFAQAAFAHVGIGDWRRHVRVDATLARPADAPEQRGNITRARVELRWQPQIGFAELVAEMVDADLAALAD